MNLRNPRFGGRTRRSDGDWRPQTDLRFRGADREAETAGGAGTKIRGSGQDAQGPTGDGAPPEAGLTETVRGR